MRGDHERRERHENGKRNGASLVVGWQSRNEKSHGWNTDQTRILHAVESIWSNGFGLTDGRAVPRIIPKQANCENAVFIRGFAQPSVGIISGFDGSKAEKSGAEKWVRVNLDAALSSSDFFAL